MRFAPPAPTDTAQRPDLADTAGRRQAENAARVRAALTAFMASAPSKPRPRRRGWSRRGAA